MVYGGGLSGQDSGRAGVACRATENVHKHSKHMQLKFYMQKKQVIEVYFPVCVCGGGMLLRNSY